MGRSTIDPQSAVRDLFGTDCQADLTPKAPKQRRRKLRSKKCPEVIDRAFKFLTVKDVARRYSVGEATVWRWVKNDPIFPEPIKLSTGTSRWKAEQLQNFEHLAAKRTLCEAKSVLGPSGSDTRKGVVK